jgi:acyl-CoA thioesterase
MKLTPLSTILARRELRGSELRFDVPVDWLQGRTSFGGLISMYAVQAMRDVAGAAWPAAVSLRALQTNFISPIEGGTVAIGVRLLREGRSVRQVQASVSQHGELVALMVGVFGSDRTSTLPPLLPQRPSLGMSPDEIAPMPFVAGRRPNFTAHFDMRWGVGAPPFTGGSGGERSSIHLRAVDPDAAGIGAELLTVLLADVSPTPVLTRFSQPVPTSSVSWALEVLPLSAQETLAGWWRADTRAVAGAGGYVNQQGMLWAPSGALAALAYQVVTVYG